MPQYVEAFGQTIEFPDGMDQAQIAAAIRKSSLSIPRMKAPDPTEGMSGFDKFAAGVGKAGYDVARGVGQLFGATSREDVADSRKRDAALMNTGTGLAGNIAANVGMLAPTAFIPGAATIPGAALIGAGAGFLQPSTSTKETLQNTAISGVAAPAALLAGRAIQAGWNGAKALVEPLTKSGQERIASDVLRLSATDPAKAAQMATNARPAVPGSQPTLGQVADDAGLAQLERTILNNPEYAPALQARYAQQRAARLGQVREVAGEIGGHYDAIREGRRIFANEDYAKAMAQGIDQDMAKAMQPQLDSLMRRPSIQEAQKVAQRLAAEQDKTLSNMGSLEGLDWTKKALDRQINAIKTGNPIGNTDLKTLVQTKNDLMKTLEQIAPGYKEANDAYAAMSKQINGMDVARSLYDKLQKPGSEYMGNSAREMGDNYTRALSMAQDSVKKSTGMDKSIRDVMPTRDIAALEGVAYDLGRKSFVENAGKAAGSPTAQNLASQNMLRRMLGPTGLPETWAESTMLQSLLSPVQIGSKLTGADRKIMERITAGLLDPQDAAGLLSAAARPRNTGLLGSPQAQRFLPATGLLGARLNEYE